MTTIALRNPTLRQSAMLAVAQAPDSAWVTVREPTRSDLQNARLWAMLADVAAACTVGGRQFTKECWKVIFMQDMGEQSTFLPQLNGGGFFPSGFRSSKMSVREMADLITSIQAYGDEQGVAWRDPSARQDDGR